MVIRANANNEVDGTAFNLLSRINTDIPIVLISKAADFKFNEELLGLDKYILVDFMEYGWDFDYKKGTHIFGENSFSYINTYNNEWYLFDNFIKKNQPLLYFKRELLKKDQTDKIIPIEYPAWYQVNNPETKEEFYSRDADVFNFWGRSHEARVALHANIWLQSSKFGYSVCDNPNLMELFFKNEKNPHKWLTFYIEHYARMPMEKVLWANGFSKISISMPGSGKKCFRHAESPINSIMAMEKNDLAWAYQWDETNSIQFELGKEVETIIEALDKPNLYDIYLKGIETCRKYQVDNYVNNYLMPLINGI